ncbi:MAG: hypothetical protein HY788_13015 [Deltaproteobacteria bacterium]|nr:hypothetical protein [Deltaproteobacteria bacterium]
MNAPHDQGPTKSTAEGTPTARDEYEVSEHVESMKPGRADRKELESTIGSETVIQRILDTSHPAQLVGKLAEEDFFWLVLDAEPDSSLEILRLASEDQWTYVLDLLIWNNEGLDIDSAVEWFERLFLVDRSRLTSRLLNMTPTLLTVFLSKTIRLWVRGHDEPVDLSGQEWFTLDEVFYLRCRRRKHRVFIEELLKELADSDFDRYYAVMFASAEIIPAEEEEGLKDLRNARLADKGFVSWDEAMLIYSHIKPSQIYRKVPVSEYFSESDEEPGEGIPVTPVLLAESRDAFSRALSSILDTDTLDRLRLEFAGLCNMALSGEGCAPDEVSVLKRVYRKASGMVSIGIERTDAEPSVVLQENALIDLFRLGFSAVLDLKWKAEKWWKSSWAHGQGLSLSFWDRSLEGMLQGLFRKRPLRYDAASESQPFVDFDSVEEVQACDRKLDTLEALDAFLEASCRQPIPDGEREDPFFTYKRCLYTIWARSSLDLDPVLSPLTASDLNRFFDRMAEAGGEVSAWSGPEVMDAFFDALKAHMPQLSSDHWRRVRAVYKELLDSVRDAFGKVKRADLDARYVDLFRVWPGREETSI